MKKIFIPLFVIATLSITSCHKSRTCTCTNTTTFTSGSSSSTSTSTDTDVYGHATKHEASVNCVSGKATTSTSGGSIVTVSDCKLS